MSENSKRSVYVRFDKEVYDQLQQMSQDSGESITELGPKPGRTRAQG